MDGLPWQNPDHVYAVQQLMPELSNLRGAVIAFFQGAKTCWERFSSEFEEDGPLASLSPEDHVRVFASPTNDHNEGALGSFRVWMRNFPSTTLQQYNASRMYKHNNTGDFIDMHMSGEAEQSWLRAQGRKLEARNEESARKQELADYKAERAKISKEKAVKEAAEMEEKLAVLRSIAPLLDIAHLKKVKLSKSEWETQLEWHRQYELAVKRKDKQIPCKSNLSNNDKRRAALIDAVKRYNSLSLEQRVLPSQGQLEEDGLHEEWHEEEDSMDLS